MCLIVSSVFTAGVWSCPATTGERPPPCATHTFTAVDDRRAVVFGGKNEEQGRMNDVFIIDLSTMVFKRHVGTMQIKYLKTCPFTTTRPQWVLCSGNTIFAQNDCSTVWSHVFCCYTKEMHVHQYHCHCLFLWLAAESNLFRPTLLHTSLFRVWNFGGDSTVYVNGVYYSRNGANSTSQEVDLGQRRGPVMQLVVSTMASSSLNYWWLGERTDGDSH